MAMVRLQCAVYESARVFAVNIDSSAWVSSLQTAIVDQMKELHVKPASVTLYLARKHGAWLKREDKLVNLLKGGVDPHIALMLPSRSVNHDAYFGASFQSDANDIHVLVALPHAHAKRGAWSAENTVPMDLQAQQTVKKSVVCVSSVGGSVATAVLIDQTPSHIYLLTNLHVWAAKAFTRYMSDEFEAEVHGYLVKHPRHEPSRAVPLRGRVPRGPKILVQQLEQTDSGETLRRGFTFGSTKAFAGNVTLTMTWQSSELRSLKIWRSFRAAGIVCSLRILRCTSTYSLSQPRLKNEAPIARPPSASQLRSRAQAIN